MSVDSALAAHQGPGHTLSDDLSRQRQRWQFGAVTDAAYAASYFLLWQIARHGPAFASRATRAVQRPDRTEWRRTLLSYTGAELDAVLAEWFGAYRFYRIAPAVPEAFRHWLRQDWPLQLLSRIPSPREVLTMQANGRRPVTLIDLPRALQPILTKPDGLAFLVHDLEHAWKFFNDPRQFALQQTFFALLSKALAAGIFAPYQSDLLFMTKLDYLISDMNTHPAHGLLYLHAVLIEMLLRQEHKSPRESLSEAARQVLGDLIHELGSYWAFSPAGMGALGKLARGQFDPAVGQQLEQALMALNIRTIQAPRPLLPLA